MPPARKGELSARGALPLGRLAIVGLAILSVSFASAAKHILWSIGLVALAMALLALAFRFHRLVAAV